MGILRKKPFIVIDLGSGRYLQTNVGHEYYNLIKNQIDGRYYGYCPPYGDIDIRQLGAKKTDESIGNILVIYTQKIPRSSNRKVIAFTDNATVHRHGIIDEKLQRKIEQKGDIKHCSYSIESDSLYLLESYFQEFVIEIAKYSVSMFRKQRFYKGKYKDLDKDLIQFLENYLDNKEYYEDEVYQKEIQNKEIPIKDKYQKTYDIKPECAEMGGSLAVKKNPAFAKQALVDSDYICQADPSHNTFKTQKGVPYMEGHHLIPCTANNAQEYWKRYGKSIDCVENIVCLCPTCHRRIHFGSDDEKKTILQSLYNKQLPKLKKAGLNITEKELIKLYHFL